MYAGAVNSPVNPFTEDGWPSGSMTVQQRGEACYQQSGPTTSDLAERFTGPSRECMEWLGEMAPSTYDVYSWFAGCASSALESAPKWSTSESSRARQSVNPAAAAYILRCAAGSFLGQ